MLLPNAWDVASAAALVAAGHPAIGTTSLGVAAAAGHRDAAGTTWPHTLTLVRAISRLDCLLTVDIEAGFGTTPQAVADVAVHLASAGAVGVNIEDGRGHDLAPVEEQADRIAAIKAATPGMFVNARIDTYWIPDATDGQGAETLARAMEYQDAGADGLFVPGLDDVDLIRTLAAGGRPFLNLLYSPGGPSLQALGGLGVARVSTGSLLFRAALHAVVTATTDIQAGDPAAGAGLPSYADIQALTSLKS